MPQVMHNGAAPREAQRRGRGPGSQTYFLLPWL